MNRILIFLFTLFVFTCRAQYRDKGIIPFEKYTYEKVYFNESLPQSILLPQSDKLKASPRFFRNNSNRDVDEAEENESDFSDHHLNHIQTENDFNNPGGNNILYQTQGNWYSRGPDRIREAYGSVRGLGRIFPIAVSVDTNIVYACSQNGDIFRSFDRGTTWMNPVDSFSWRTPVIYLVTDPFVAGVCYAVTTEGKFYKTIDTGNVWFQLPVDSVFGWRPFIAISTADNQLIYALQDNFKLTKSLDGGNTWTTVNNIVPWSLALKPGSRDVLYGAKDSIFYKSVDGGITFDSVCTLPLLGNYQSIGVTPDDTNYVYVSGLSKSIDGGNTFVSQQQTPSWGSDIYVSPVDKNLLFSGFLTLSRSIDGGVTWNAATRYNYNQPGAFYTHPDHRSFQFAGSAFWEGNDGSITVTDDRGVTFQDKSVGLAISQFKSISNSESDTSVFVCGANDNAFILHTDSGWANIFDNDGIAVSINPLNKFDMFLQSYNGAVYHTTDGGFSFDSSGTFGGLNEYNIYYTVRFNHQNPNSLFVLAENVWKSVNDGDSVVNISNGQINLQHTSFLYVCSIDSNIIFTSDNYTTNGGLTWKPTNKTILAVDPDEPNKIWGFDRSVWNLGPQQMQYFYFSIDTGLTWSQIHTNYFGPIANTFVATCTNNSFDGIFFMSDDFIGYYDNRLSNIQPFIAGLPDVNFSDIAVVSTGNKIRLATYGRGAWESDMFDPGQAPVADFAVEFDTICPGDTIRFYDNSLNNGPGYSPVYSWSFPGGSPATSNNPNPEIIYSAPGVYQVSLHIQNANGTDSITKNNFIYVDVPPIVSLPYSETFESDPYAIGWDRNHNRAPAYWGHWDNSSTMLGGYEHSHGSIGYSYQTGDLSFADYISSPLFDISSIPDPVVSFDYYYGYNFIDPDTFKIFYTPDCGFTRNYIYTIPSRTLGTDSGQVYNFSPDSTEWRTDTFSLHSISSNGMLQLGFEMNSTSLSLFLIDNLNIFSSVTTRANTIENTNSTLSAFPNPFTDNIIIKWNSQDPEAGELYIWSASGQLISHEAIISNEQTNISLEANGIYFLELRSSNTLLRTKIVKY